MDMQVREISSNDLIPIEQHFRVSAGPGAGKTYWLINHLMNILSNSERLCKTRKIACITFTNIAVETILSRFDCSLENLEVSTIHSFLYKNIIKPYVKFIASDYNLNHEKIDGHDDRIVSNYSFIKDWKSETGQFHLENAVEIVSALSKAKWKFDANLDLVIDYDRFARVNGYSLKKDSYLVYKKMAWGKGIIHHDDILFFSYKIILKYPFVLQVIRAKFPYFLLDEFQDTNPIQTEIIKKIGEKETVVGIIGDRAQSIYSFQGVDSSAFSSFFLPGIKDYQILHNRRSTQETVAVLNHIRTDIMQKPFQIYNGNTPMIMYGDMISSYELAQSICGDEDIYSLVRVNVTANSIQYKMSDHLLSDNLTNKYESLDSNYDRKKIVIACMRAAELSHYKKFKEASKCLNNLFSLDSTDKKRKVVKSIYMLVSNYENFKNKSLLEFVDFISTNICTVSKITRGKLKDFCDDNSYNNVAMYMNYTEDLSLFRTIHKSKGDEFNNVFLALKNTSHLSFLTKPDLLNNEEHRINYVAVSRAKKRLFIYVPIISETERRLLSHLFSFRELKS